MLIVDFVGVVRGFRDLMTALIGFEPEICICNGNYLVFKRESVLNERSVSVMAIHSSGSAILYL